MVDNTQKSSPTNIYDVIIKIIDSLTGPTDQGRVGAASLILFFIGCMYIAFSRMESSDARGVTEEFIHALFQFPIDTPLTFLLLGALIVVVPSAKYKISILQGEINRLVGSRDALLHYKEECFDFIKDKIEKGEIATYEDLKMIVDMRDIEHKSSHFKLK